MKTAIQELIETIDTIVRALPNEALGAKNQAIIIRGKAHSLLEKEKQQIMEAVKTGMWETEIPNDLQEYGENYYDSNFCGNHEAGI